MIYTTVEFFRLGYKKLQEMSDPRLEQFPLMGSPISLVVIVTLYVSFVFRIGPRCMKKRAPYELKKVIKYYNLLQIVFNSFGVIMGTLMFPYSNILCMPLDRSATTEAMHMLILHYLYLLLKVFDLFDTVFFVLRKKYNQITFLHIYHHVTMVVGTWMTCNYVPGGQLYYLGFINCFVHVVMYFYYYLTSLDSKYKNSIWWKKHITQLQITQHCFVFFSFFIPLVNPDCNYPKLLLGIYLPWVVLMIYLFSNFYIKTYIKKKVPNNKKH